MPGATRWTHPRHRSPAGPGPDPRCRAAASRARGTGERVGPRRPRPATRRRGSTEKRERRSACRRRPRHGHRPDAPAWLRSPLDRAGRGSASQPGRAGAVTSRRGRRQTARHPSVDSSSSAAMMQRVTRRLAFVLAALLIGGAGAWWLLQGGEQDRGPSYVVAAVDRGPITAEVTATGTVNPVETVQVGTYVSGPVQTVNADFNTPVKKGQLLATIDPRPFELKVAAAEAELANARATLTKRRADLELKERTWKRQQDLRGQGIVSQSDLDTAESEARQAEAQIALAAARARSAEARLAAARANRDYPRLGSPVDGVVVSRNVSVRQTVAASLQTPRPFRVATDLTKREVSASVSESGSGGVSFGQDVRFTGG